MSTPIIRRHQDLPWEQWPAEQVAERGKIMWKTLLDDAAQGANMVMGVARLCKGDTLEPHRHAEPETYFILSGRGIATIEGVDHPVQGGTMVFIPGNALHQIANVDDEELQFLYVFATQEFDQIVYRF